MKKIFYFLMLLGCFSCKEPMPTPIIPEPSLTIDQGPCDTCENCDESDGVAGPKCLWKNPMTPNKELMFSELPFIHDDFVIYTLHLGSKKFAPIMFFNKKTGKKIGEWQEYESESAKYVSAYHVYKNTLLALAGTRIYAIDLNTFKTKWVTKTNDFGGYEIGAIGNSVFYEGLNQSKSEIYLNKGYADSKKVETIFSETVDPSLYKIGYSDFNTFLDGKDTTVIWWKFTYNYKTYKQENILYSYNVTAKKLNYSLNLEAPEINGGFNTGQQTMRDGKLFVSFQKGQYCIDLKVGKILWNFRLPNLHTCQSIVGNDGNVYVMSMGVPNYGLLHCIDGNTGIELWNLKVENSGDELAYHNGIIYFRPTGTTKLTAVDAATQKIVWSYKIKETLKTEGTSNASYLSSLTIDKATNKIFANSNTTAYCFDVYK